MSKQIGLLCLTLVIALAGMGAGYAHWSQTLDLNVTVQTGDLDAGWSVEDFGDDEPPEKDVSSINCYTSAAGGSEESPHKLHVEITNAYPSITYYCDFDIHNDGSIPLHIGEFVINRGDLPDGATVTITDLECTQLHPCESAYGTLEVHLDNDAEQDTNYTFEITVDVYQWNESVCPG